MLERLAGKRPHRSGGFHTDERTRGARAVRGEGSLSRLEARATGGAFSPRHRAGRVESVETSRPPFGRAARPQRINAISPRLPTLSSKTRRIAGLPAVCGRDCRRGAQFDRGRRSIVSCSAHPPKNASPCRLAHAKVVKSGGLWCIGISAETRNIFLRNFREPKLCGWNYCGIYSIEIPNYRRMSHLPAPGGRLRQMKRRSM